MSGKNKIKENISPTDQIWFFIQESTKRQNFYQGISSLAEITKNGISLQKCLDLAKITNRTTAQCTFYIHSESMSAAVNMLHDQAIMSTWQIYCKKDKVVCIHIRDAEEDSPNVSLAASHKSSLAERRKVSRSAIPEIVLRPRLRDTSKDFDVITDEPISKFDDTEKVIIECGEDGSMTFTKDYLLSK